jgi:hypothetical protein
VLAALLLVIALVMSPERYVLAPLALLAGLAFIRLPRPGLALAATVPYVALANLEAIVHPSGQPYPSEVVLLAALPVVAWRDPGSWRFSRSTAFAVAFGLWMAIAAAGAARETDSAGVVRLVRMGFLGAAMFALGLAVARREHGARTAIDAALGAAGVMGILSLGEGVIGAFAGRGIGPIGSAVGGPELLALHLTLLAPPALALVALGRDPARATRILLVIAGLALVATRSRSGWMGGWAAILGMGILGCKVAPRGGKGLVGLALGVAGLGVAGALILRLPGIPGGALGERLRELTPASLFAARRADWGNGLRTIRAHPWFGQPDGPNAYNLFLGLAATSGLPILLAWGAVLWNACASGLRTLRLRSAAAPEAIGLIGAVIGLLVTGIGEATLGARLMPPAFLILGLLQGSGAAPVRERVQA